MNGTTDAWTINFGYVVSDSFLTSSSSSVAGLDIWVWEFPGEYPSSVDWSITDRRTVAPSIAPVRPDVLTDQYVSTNQYGYDIDKISVSGLNVGIGNGACYLNLQNAVAPNGDPVYWDENSGLDCRSQGCPSQAFESSIGTIPSEAFDIIGNNYVPECVHDVPKDAFKIIHSFTAQSNLRKVWPVTSAGHLYGATALAATGLRVWFMNSPRRDRTGCLLPCTASPGGADGVGPMP